MRKRLKHRQIGMSSKPWGYNIYDIKKVGCNHIHFNWLAWSIWKPSHPACHTICGKKKKVKLNVTHVTQCILFNIGFTKLTQNMLFLFLGMVWRGIIIQQRFLLYILRSSIFLFAWCVYLITLLHSYRIIGCSENHCVNGQDQ